VGKAAERSQPCEGLASIHQPARTKSSALRTVQDGCPSHSSSTQVAYIVVDPKSFKQEALDPLQASKQASKQAPHAVHLLLSADQAAMLLEPLLPHDENRFFGR
jgi:hypothetical protein